MDNIIKGDTSFSKEAYIPTLCIFTGRSCSATKTIDQLKQKLADKEKERHEEWLTAKEWKWECDRLKKELHIAKQETLHFQNKYFAENQKAIEELEKVIEFAKTQDEFGFRKSGMEIFMFVDQQIKSLKEETNEQKA